ncbi:hypothetical protein QQF64_004006 [Cirrhinus molitorella]|uniref:Uncharacterized protein n=1 Tax=Cirrhinus molitorella TaxID=172907 RepID=A0ABR3MMX7_9TELE
MWVDLKYVLNKPCDCRHVSSSSHMSLTCVTALSELNPFTADRPPSRVPCTTMLLLLLSLSECTITARFKNVLVYCVMNALSWIDLKA